MFFDTYSQDTVFKRLSFIMHEITLDKSLTAKFSLMTHSYRANASSVSTLDGRGAVRKKKKTVVTSCTWILMIATAGSNGR